MSKVIVAALEGPSTTSNKITIASGSQLDIAGSPDGSSAINLAVDAGDVTTGTLADARLGNGHILQVVTAELTTIQSSTTDGWSDITGMPTASITLADASNKVLVWWLCGGIQGYSGNTPTTRVVRDYPSADTITTVNNHAGYANLSRGIGISPGYNPAAENCGAQANCFLDNPAVADTAIVYTMQWWNRDDSSTEVNTINAFYSWDNYVYYGAGITTLMLMEVKA